MILPKVMVGRDGGSTMKGIGFLPFLQQVIANTIGLPSVLQPPDAEEDEAEEQVAEANAQPQGEGNVGPEGPPQPVQQAPVLQPAPAHNPAGGPGDHGLLRTWLLDGFLPVEARTKSEACQQRFDMKPKARVGPVQGAAEESRDRVV